MDRLNIVNLVSILLKLGDPKQPDFKAHFECTEKIFLLSDCMNHMQELYMAQSK